MPPPAKADAKQAKQTGGGPPSTIIGKVGTRIKKMVPDAAPNDYKKMNKDGTGYDADYVWLEKCSSVCALVLTFVGVIIAIICYSLMPVTVIEDLEDFPTYSKFDERIRYQQPWLVQYPECPCTQKSVPMSQKAGGFIDKIVFDSDAMCDKYSQEAPLENHVLQGEVLACPSVVVDSLNPGLVPRSGSPYQECAAVQAMFRLMHTDLKGMCKTSVAVNKVALESWTKGYLTSQQLHSAPMLQKLLRSSLDALGLQVGMTMRAASMTSPFANAAFSPSSDTRKVLKAAGVALGTTYNVGCKKFTIGKNKVFDLTSVLQECLDSNSTVPFYTGRFNFTDNTSETYKLPCGKNMLRMAKLLNASEYDTVEDALDRGFLKGMSDARRDKRNSITISSAGEDEHEVKDDQQAFLDLLVSDASFAGDYAVEDEADGFEADDLFDDPMSDGSGDEGGSGVDEDGNGADASDVGGGGGGASDDGGGGGGDSRRLTTTANTTSSKKPVAFGGFTLTDAPAEMFRKFYGLCRPKSCSLQMFKKPNAPEVIFLLLALIGGLVSLGKNSGTVLLMIGKKLFKDVKDERVASQEASVPSVTDFFTNLMAFEMPTEPAFEMPTLPPMPTLPGMVTSIEMPTLPPMPTLPAFAAPEIPEIEMPTLPPMPTLPAIAAPEIPTTESTTPYVPPTNYYEGSMVANRSARERHAIQSTAHGMPLMPPLCINDWS